MTLTDLYRQARTIADALRRERFEGEPRERQIIALAEECGEAVGAARRHLGMARREGSIEDVAAELADVVIVAMVTAVEFGIDLPQGIEDKLSVIMTRGWRE